MNIVSKKVLALILSVIVMSSAQGMEQEHVTEITIGQPIPSAWYKNSSVQVAAVVTTVTAALVSYAVAVRMGKVSAPALPAFAAGLFAATAVHGATVQASTPEIDLNNNNSQQIEQIQEVPVQSDFLGDVKKMAIDFSNRMKNLTWDGFTRDLGEVKEKDSNPINEHLVR
jgi:hypothetical protein